MKSVINDGARNLGLRVLDCTVILHGVSGLKLGKFEFEVRNLVESVRPHFVFFEIGTNDLCDANISAVAVAHHIVDLAIWVVEEYRAKVYIGEILPRNLINCGRIWPVPLDFNERVATANTTLAQ